MSNEDIIAEMAEWRPVKGWEGRYEVSDLGDLRHVDGAPVGQWPGDQGYMRARLSQPRALVRVHRTVAEVFVPNPDNKPTVNHKDCRRDNNAAINLEWCTQGENLSHSRRLDRLYRHAKGKRSPTASLSDEEVGRIRALYEAGGWSWTSLARHVGMSKRAIGRLLSQETYRDVR